MNTKYTLLTLLLLIVTLFSPLVSNANAIGITTIKAKLNGNYSVEQKEEILKILKSRFKYFSKKDVNVKIEDDSIIVKIFIEVESRYCTDLMTKRGELLILRPYSKEELYPDLRRIDSLLSTPNFKTIKGEMYNASINEIVEEVYIESAEPDFEIPDYNVEEQGNDDLISAAEEQAVDNYVESAYSEDYNPLFNIMDPNIDGNYGGAFMGTSHKRDTAKINNLFRNPVIKKHLPSDIRFIWATTNSWHKQYITLCAIKNPSPNNEYVTNYMIESAKTVQSRHYNAEANIQFKKEYHALWVTTQHLLNDGKFNKMRSLKLNWYIWNAMPILTYRLTINILQFLLCERFNF